MSRGVLACVRALGTVVFGVYLEQVRESVDEENFALCLLRPRICHDRSQLDLRGAGTGTDDGTEVDVEVLGSSFFLSRPESTGRRMGESSG